MNNEPDTKPEQSPTTQSRLRVRFGLLELLLLTGVVAAWLSMINARQKILVLESEIDSMRYATSQLLIIEQDKLNIRSLPTVWHNIDSWKYSAPPEANLELRLATDGINSVAKPAKFQAFALPDGEHSIHLKSINGKDGCRTFVYINNELAMQQDHPPEWLTTQGSSSTSDVSLRSSAHELGKPLTLKLQKYTVAHPLNPTQSTRIPEYYDQKGNYLWISPRGAVPEPAPDFLTSKSNTSRGGIGHRQGTQVRFVNLPETFDLIGVQPSFSATLGDERYWKDCAIGISVRPVASEGAAAELPENTNRVPQKVGHKIVLTDSIQPPNGQTGLHSQTKVSEKATSQDGQSMKTFAHFDAFPSGAKPIVEVLFDSAFPNRVGFLPHAAPDSTPMYAVQFVTRFDANFLWREVELVTGETNSKKTANVPLSQLNQKLGIKESSATGSAGDRWNRIPISKLPRAALAGSGASVSRFSAITDEVDTSTINYPLGLSRDWKYEGVANRQVWWLPVSAENKDDTNISVEIRDGKNYPATKLAIPGGPAIQNVRITVPMPAKEPVWLEIVAESEWKGK